MTSIDTTVAPAEQTGLRRSSAMSVFAAVLLGTLISALDRTIVSNAMPRITAQLHGLDSYAWVFTAYMLAETATMPIWGKLSDMYGRKWLYMGSMAVFLVGSWLSGAAQSMDMLILFRALQGMGAGAMLPIGQAIVGDIFAPAERAKYQGLTIAVYGLASIFGPVLGGYLTDYWSWRWAFYINVPIGALALTIVALRLRNNTPVARPSIDYCGALLLVAGVVPLLLAFSWAGSSYAWGSPQILGLLLCALVGLGLFVVVERRAAEPIVPLSLFRNDIFAISALATMLSSIGLFGATLYSALFVQGVMGRSATSAGLFVMPLMLGVIVSSALSGQIVGRWGRYRVLACAGLGAAALGLWLLAQMHAGTTTTVLIANLVLFGLGLGIVMPLFTIIVQNAVDQRILGAATSSLAFFRAIGGTIGVAVLGSLLTNTFRRELLLQAPAGALPADRLATLDAPAVLLAPQTQQPLAELLGQTGLEDGSQLAALQEAVRAALTAAIHDVYLVGALLMLVAAITCIFLREIPLRRTRHASDS